MGRLDLKVLLHHRRDARIRLRGRRGSAGGAVELDTGCWIGHGRRNLANFARRSYRFAPGESRFSTPAHGSVRRVHSGETVN